MSDPMLADVLAQPAQIGDALWRVEAASIPATERSGGLLVCGMGGSAIGGDLAAAAIGDRATAPLRVARGYTPGPSLASDTLVLCASYSGSTEETLACFDAVGAAGAQRVVLTTGGALAERAREAEVPVIGVPSGMQPRAAVVYMTVAALECAALCGAGPSLKDELEGSEEVLSGAGRRSRARPVSRARCSTRSRWCMGRGSPRRPLAAGRPRSTRTPRWRPSRASFPRPTTTRSRAGSTAASWARWRRCSWRTRTPTTRIKRRTEVYADVLAGLGAPVARVAARGDTPVARVLSLVMLGDLVSVRLAELAGVEATPVQAIEGFKSRL